MSKTLETPPFDSPVRHVMRFLPFVAASVAPEKAAPLRELRHEVLMNLTNGGTWDVHIELRDGKSEITFSRRTMELLWCAAFGHVVIYSRLFEGRRENIRRVFSLTDDSELNTARRLLAWAYSGWLAQTDSYWPEDLPRPLENPTVGSRESVADELALVASGMLVHHELAHHYLRHGDAIDKLDAERDADNAAVDWILGGIDERDPRFRKRSLGVALAFAAITAIGIHSNSFAGKRHPRTFDRLMGALDRHIADADHPTWAFVLSLLKIHLDEAQVMLPDRAYPSFRAAVDAYVDALAT